MNVLDAAYHTVHDYPGGAEALAVRLGKRGSSLSHEVAGNMPNAKLGLADALTIMRFSSDLRMLHAQASELGCMVLPLPDIGGTDAGTAGRLAQVAREFADVMGDVVTATADGVLTDNELANIERSWGELIAAGGALLKHVRGMNEQSRPKGTPGLRRAA